MKDGVMIAFYPVFGEVVFFFFIKIYRELQKRALGNTVETHTEVMRRKVPVKELTCHMISPNEFLIIDIC